MSIVLITGVLTMCQAMGQLTFSVLAILQYFCVVDILRLPLLAYIKIIYFHNPSTCGSSVNLGKLINGIPNQAFVFLPREPFTSTRTLIINCSSLALAFLWIIASLILMLSAGTRTEVTEALAGEYDSILTTYLTCGAAGSYQTTKWPWVVITGVVCCSDIVAVIAFANDSFNTQTLSDMVDYIGGVSSGFGNVDLETHWVVWSMAILYSRGGALFFLNLALLITMVSRERTYKVSKEASDSEGQSKPLDDLDSTRNDVVLKSATYRAPYKLPRPSILRVYPVRHMNTSMATSLAQIERNRIPNEGVGKEVRFGGVQVSPAGDRVDELCLRVPAESTTSGAPLPPTGRRGTTIGLQSQFPWAYVPLPPTRDEVRPVEALPTQERPFRNLVTGHPDFGDENDISMTNF